jgi:hypothetical protein
LFVDIHADQRRLAAQAAPGALAYLRGARNPWLDQQIAVAKALATVEASGAFLLEGHASIVECAVRLGYPGSMARQLADLGRALAAAPELEAEMRNGGVPLPNAAALGWVLSRPEYHRPGDDWLWHARVESLRALRRRVKRRVEEVEQRAPGVVDVTVHVPEAVKADFDRARVVASRRTGSTLTEGQAFAHVLDDYLDAHDPARVAPGHRRVGPTAGRPRSRYVPVTVRRALEERSGGCCEFAGCPNRIFLQTAHFKPHREGSGRELEDLGRLCSRHHLMLDAGTITFAGLDDRGRPKFQTLDGTLVCHGDTPLVPDPEAHLGSEPEPIGETLAEEEHGLAPETPIADLHPGDSNADGSAVVAEGHPVLWEGRVRDGQAPVGARPPPWEGALVVCGPPEWRAAEGAG